jgi:iron complex outermembrane recepter protein
VGSVKNKYQFILLMGFLSVLTAHRAWAQSNVDGTEGETQAREIGGAIAEIPHLSDLEHPATSVDEWIAQLEQEVVQITAVQLISTEGGIEVRLETAEGELDTPVTSVVGNALIAEIPNAVLALPEGDFFEQFDPAEGIALLSVTGLPNNRVRLSITGTDAPPEAQLATEAGNLVLSVMPGVAGTAAEQDDAIQVVVTATRTEEDILNVPRSVTVITREEIEAQSNLTTNVQDILGQTVPGLGPPTQRFRNSPQTLRGRQVQILVDGVPISTNQNTAFSQELRSIAPSAIERIEVVRGPSAVFGEGATGGIINIITRRPGDELRTTVETRVTSRGNLAAESFGTYIEYGFSGPLGGPVDGLFNFSWEAFGYSFDAEGDRIPNFEDAPENGRTINVLGRLGFDISDDQRLQVSVNHFSDTQEVEFISDPSLNDFPPGTRKAEALRIQEPEFIGINGDPRRVNTVVNLDYTHNNLLGSQVALQGFYRENFGVIGLPFDNRDFGGDPPFVTFNQQDSERWGGRLQIDTPFSEAVSLLWGADYSQENLSQPQQFFDVDEFDRSGGRVFRVIEENFTTPPYEVDTLGLFAQLSWDISDRLLLSGGARYENISASVDDYTVFGAGFEPDQDIEGGSVNADGVAFNVGAVYQVTDELSLFASFAQGFGVPDLGRIFRSPPSGFTSVNEDLIFTQPQTIDNYELGIRGNWRDVQFSLAGFYSYSDSGVSFNVVEVGQGLTEIRVARAPRRIYGVEATADWQPSPTWQLGGLVSWNEGEDKQDEDGDFVALGTRDIQPIKVSAYVENETLPGWRNRLQALLVGDRDRGFNVDRDPQSIESYFVVDYISSIQAGPGVIQIGIQNLFDNQYFPVASQLSGGFSNVNNRAAPGRTLSLGYRVTW